MQFLARLSLKNRAVVALLTLAIAAAGLYSMASLKQELIPDIEFPRTTVVTALPGASPEVVDEQVALPLSRALETVDGVESVSSESQQSASLITVRSEFDADRSQVESELRSALEAAADELPEGAEPEIMAGSLSDIPAVMLTVSSAAPAEDLVLALREDLVPALRGIEGVRDVTLAGGATQRVAITPDGEALAAAGLTPQAFEAALEANGDTLPAGSVLVDGQNVTVQAGQAIETVEALRELPLLPASGAGPAPDAAPAPGPDGELDPERPGTTTPGAPVPPADPVPLGDVATVEVAGEPADSITRTNGEPSVSVTITKMPDADVVRLSHAVSAALPAATDALGVDADLTTIFDQAPFIEESIQHLALEGALGLLFAVAVILLFLFSMRATVVTAVSIPLSVLVTFAALHASGYSLNMLTLGALTISIGRVVDDSIVVIENIKRHLAYGEAKSVAIFTAVREVAGAITSSTVATVVVFLPIVFVSDMVGELFRPFSLTVTIAMLSSLLVALTIVPVLAYWFMRPPAGDVDPDAVRRAAEEKEASSRLQRAYLPLLRRTQRRPLATLLAAVVLLAGTAAVVPLLKVDFLGSAGSNTYRVTQEFDSAASLDTVSETAAATEDALLGVDGVESVLLTVGGDGFARDTSAGTFMVTADAGADQTRIRGDIQAAVTGLDAGEDIDLGETSAVGSGTVDVELTANDADTLAVASELVTDALAGVEHAEAPTSDLGATQDSLQVRVDRPAAAEAGLTELQVASLVAAAGNERPIGQVRIDGEALDVVVLGGDSYGTVEELRDLPLPSAAGPLVLDDVADVVETRVRDTVARSGQDLVATVALAPEEGRLGEVSDAVAERLAGIELPDGATYAIGGATADQTEAFEQLGLAMLAAIAIVYVLLVATFRSLVQPLILLVSVPFAATGALLLLLATGRPLAVASLIGLLMLIGIVVTNAIVLIDLVNQYRAQGQGLHDAVENGARQRLRPILMTALATICALTPMALGVTGSSGFISQDLAIVVIGGLVSSTALTLILVPVLYRLFEGRQERRRGRSPREPETALIDLVAAGEPLPSRRALRGRRDAPYA
ncbi:efflux RND transporter permease subunit [Zhihengliuella alba]|uniref:Efflux RND transporter permease subunit n=1 Tax=Zhihengliuella alba TaxID=547018 RepID=A0ABP7D5F5_9MICC